MTQIEKECRELQLQNTIRHYQNNLGAFAFRKTMGRPVSDSLVEWHTRRLEAANSELSGLSA